ASPSRRGSAAPEERAEQARGLAAGDDDAVAGEELVVGGGVAADLDAEPVDLEDLVGPAGGVGADEVGLLGQAVGAEAGLEDAVKDGLVAGDREARLVRHGPQDVEPLALRPVDQADRDLD